MNYVHDLKRYLSLMNPNGTITRKKLMFNFFTWRMFPVLLIRLMLFLHSVHLGVLAKIVAIVNLTVFGLECSSRITIGPGLFIPHSVGVVIGAYSIGSNATIYQGVTLGAKSLDFSNSSSERPIIGNNVTIASGAKILGGISIGNHAVVAANAVVIRDVKEYTLVGGVPAKQIKAISVHSNGTNNV